jgi:hypothetical protein
MVSVKFGVRMRFRIIFGTRVRVRFSPRTRADPKARSSARFGVMVRELTYF